MNFEHFLIEEYRLGVNSAKDYVGRLNGIINKGIYNGENHITPSMEVAIELEYPNFKNPYKLALRLYMEYRDKILNG